MRKAIQMKIDTEIRHVTKPGANLFLELGFAKDEALKLQAASENRCVCLRAEQLALASGIANPDEPQRT